MDNPTQEIPQQQPTQPEIQTRQSNSSWLRTLSIGLGVIGIGLVIGIGGYVLGTKKSQPVQINPKPISKPISISPTAVSPNDTSDETANWQTYSSNQYSYSIKYPKELSFSTLNYQGFSGTIKNSDKWTNTDQSYIISVLSYKTGDNSGLEFNLQSQPTTTMQVSSQTVNKMISVDETLIHVGPINNAGYEYMIVYSSGIKKSIKGLSLFDQILSTFKLTK